MAKDQRPTDGDATLDERRVPAGSRRPRRLRLAGGAVALAASGALLAACGSGSPSTPKSVEGTAAPATDTSTSAAQSPSSDESSAQPSEANSSAATAQSSTTAASPRSSASVSASASSGHTAAATTKSATSTRCHTSELKATVGSNDPGAGQENFPLVLTNTSGHTCTVYGFPGFAFVDSSGHQVSADPGRTNMAKQVVKLAPGHSAWAALHFPNPGVVGGATVTPAAVRITPPDEKAFLTVHWVGGPVTKKPTRAAAAEVGPLQPGRGPGSTG